MKPKLIVIAGPNGSGKTSMSSKFLDRRWIEGCTYINPDNIAKDTFGDWNAPEATNYTDPKLLFRVADGKLEKEYGSMTPWAVDLIRAVR